MGSDKDIVTVTKYAVVVCWHCAHRTRTVTLPDVCAGMADGHIRAELGLEDEDDIPDEISCFRCDSSLDLDEGFWTEIITAEEAFGLCTPPGTQGRRPSRAIRDFVRKRDLRTCAICRRELDWNECTVDHVRAWCKGGKTEPNNLVVSCQSCNQLKGNREFEIQTVISPALLVPCESEPLHLSPEEADEALSRLLTTMECLVKGAPLHEINQEITKKMRLLRRQMRT